MSRILTIGLSKGYLMKEALHYFETVGIIAEPYNDRQLILWDTTHQVRFLILRPTDVPVYVQQGIVDLGVTGLDMIREEEPDVCVLRDLKFGACRLSVCGDVNRPLSELTHGVRVATKFTNCTQKYFESLGIKVDIIKLYGSVELAAITGLSDFVVDLVATGKTLEENGLKEQITLFDSTAHLVANPVFYSLHFEQIKRFIAK